MLIWICKLTKNSDPDKCKNSGYRIGFDYRSVFSSTDRGIGRNAIIFGADINSSVQDILIVGEGPTQGLDNTILTGEVIYPINFTQANKRFVLNLDYNGCNSLLFVNSAKIYQFKAKNFEIKDCTLCLGNI